MFQIILLEKVLFVLKLKVKNEKKSGFREWTFSKGCSTEVFFISFQLLKFDCLFYWNEELWKLLYTTSCLSLVFHEFTMNQVFVNTAVFSDEVCLNKRKEKITHECYWRIQFFSNISCKDKCHNLPRSLCTILPFHC